MTVGILLKRLQSALESNELSFFDTITHFVIDEVHERDIDTDLLLVILKRIIQDRVRKGAQPPKLILMSATIEAKVFQQYFTSITRKNIPILEIPGKIYPVTRYYLEDIVGDLNQRPGSGQHAWVFQVSWHGSIITYTVPDVFSAPSTGQTNPKLLAARADA